MRLRDMMPAIRIPNSIRARFGKGALPTIISPARQEQAYVTSQGGIRLVYADGTRHRILSEVPTRTYDFIHDGQFAAGQGYPEREIHTRRDAGSGDKISFAYLRDRNILLVTEVKPYVRGDYVLTNEGPREFYAAVKPCDVTVNVARVKSRGLPPGEIYKGTLKSGGQEVSYVHNPATGMFLLLRKPSRQTDQPRNGNDRIKPGIRPNRRIGAGKQADDVPSVEAKVVHIGGVPNSGLGAGKPVDRISSVDGVVAPTEHLPETTSVYWKSIDDGVALVYDGPLGHGLRIAEYGVNGDNGTVKAFGRSPVEGGDARNKMDIGGIQRPIVPNKNNTPGVNRMAAFYAVLGLESLIKVSQFAEKKSVEYREVDIEWLISQVGIGSILELQKVSYENGRNRSFDNWVLPKIKE